MYTLQSQYLASHPVVLSPLASTAVLWTGIGGYVIFRSVNYQKDLVRRTKGDCEIWGRPAGVQRCRYMTADGKDHESLLLYTGKLNIFPSSLSPMKILQSRRAD